MAFTSIGTLSGDIIDRLAKEKGIARTSAEEAYAVYPPEAQARRIAQIKEQSAKQDIAFDVEAHKAIGEMIIATKPKTVGELARLIHAYEMLLDITDQALIEEYRTQRMVEAAELWTNPDGY